MTLLSAPVLRQQAHHDMLKLHGAAARAKPSNLRSET